MRRQFLGWAILGLGLLAGCSSDWDGNRGRAVGTASTTPSMDTAAGVFAASGKRASYAALPDRGQLLAYDPVRGIEHAGGSTWYPVDLSEAHALRATLSGDMVVTAPDGQPIRLRYQRHIEHPDGNWTWIGRPVGLASVGEAVLTFGEKAVFGTIPTADSGSLQLTMKQGRSWLVLSGQSLLDGNTAAAADTADYLIPPDLGAKLGVDARVMAAADGATPTVDVVLGYTTGFAAKFGGQSAAVTRLNNLVDIVNAAYVRSLVNAQVRLVHTLEVAYPDATSNSDTLEKLTGYRSGSAITPDPAFSALRAARDQYGADLVSLVRVFKTPENAGCGIAWLIGGNLSTIDASDAPFGYSVVSDGSDIDEGDGKNYGCRQETLAHEFGHNMGQAHNVEDSSTPGAHPYSYGYREVDPTGFYTIMAYKLKDSSQFTIGNFANPAVFFKDGRPTGVANTADNARSLNLTVPLIATFRATVMTAPPLDLFAIAKNGASGRTEVHVLEGETNFQTYSRHHATALGATGSDYTWRFQLGDFNGDGYADLYAINKTGASGRTEVHVLSGADGFQSFLLNMATALGPTGSDNAWNFRLGHYNQDGKLDLYAIARTGASGRTEVHVLNGADNFNTFLAHVATALYQTGSDGSWNFQLGDLNRDGALDVFAIAKSATGSGTTELHVLNGANGFQSYLLNTATALGTTGSNNAWDFKVGDFNQDGTVDVYAIGKLGASGRTDVHVLDGGQGFLAFSAHVATPLGTTGSDDAWEFELAAR